MCNKPLVSVFLPYYNDEKFIRHSIESVINQSYDNWELILLNHATTDSCRDIAHSYEDKRIKHIDMDVNLGAGGGILFEKMLLASEGKYIKTLCADDILRKDCLATLVDYMESNPEIDFAFGDIEYVDENGNDLKTSWFKNRDGFSVDNNEADCIRLYSQGYSFLPYIGNISKREIFANIHINKTFVMLFDMSLWLSLLCKGYKIGYCNELVADYRISNNQLSSVHNSSISSKYGIYEFINFDLIFYSITSIELAKKVFNQSKYKDMLVDVSDIPFFVAINMFLNGKLYAYSFLSEELQDPQKREHYIKTLGFGIRELRHYCLQKPNKKKQSLLGMYKDSLYQTHPKHLSIVELMFLFLRKIYELFSLRVIIKKYKKKRYSL